MKRVIAVGLLTALAAACLCFGDISPILEKADRLHYAERHEEARELLTDSLDSAGTDAERAELYCKISRAILNIGDSMETGEIEEDELIALFEEGEEYAAKAIEADPDNHLGYYWKSANIGRAGQVRGVLNSLFAARPMRELLDKAITLNPDHPDSYYVLGQLYEQLPGFPLSFGNKDYAVSLGRKSVFLLEKALKSGAKIKMDYDYWTELAKHLYARGWDASKRQKEFAKKIRKKGAAEGILEESFYYECELDLKDASDQEEALDLLNRAIKELKALRNPTDEEIRDLEEAQDLMQEWES
jgi:tetratricopeptide (TPR) repeat protein